MTRFTAILGGLLLSGICHAATLEVNFQPTTKDSAGNALPASGPGSLISHRVEVGSCNPDGSFGVQIAAKVIQMPSVKATLSVPLGLVCVRAFASNAYGEGLPYPVVAVGPPPSNGGSILTVVFGP